MLENIETIFEVMMLTVISAAVLWGMWVAHNRQIESPNSQSDAQDLVRHVNEPDE